jgi:hypothetical protein
MAGLLDFLNTDEGRLGLGLLSAGGYSPTPMSAGQRIQSAFAGQDAYKQQQMRNGLLSAQIEETKAQAEERKNKLALAQKAQADQFAFLNGSAGGVSPGAFAPPADGVGPTLARGDAPMGGGVLAQARAMGIPESAIKADMLFNGGKKISELLAKHGAPDMQTANGFVYDRNRVGAGFLPQLNISQDGKASMVQIGPDGLPVVSAPTGALNTFAGYRNIDESAKANFDPVTVTPQGENPQMTTRGALVRRPQVQGVQPGTPAVRDAGRIEILNQEVTKAQAQLQNALRTGDTAGAERATTDLTSLGRELAALGSKPGASVGLPLQSEAEKTALVDAAKNDAVIKGKFAAGAERSKDTIANIKRARELFDKGPTASGVGSLVDSAANFFGTSTTGADAASSLKTLSGWMVANVPRMEGPQSDFDVKNYKTMAAQVGDESIPLSQRRAALDELERLQNKYSNLNGSDAPAPPIPKIGMVRNGYKYKGGNPADQNNWEKQ